MTAVAFSLHGNIAVATVNNPPVNALSLAVREGLMDAVRRTGTDPAIEALVLIGGGTTFVAGADINDFGKPYEKPTLYDIIDAFAACPKPVVAAIHGTALGGGLELALACHWRIALPAAKIGQPEVKLGLMPGGGGTQWWLRLAGPQVALDVTTSGNPVGAVAAHEYGMVDRLADGNLLDGAVAYAAEIVASGTPRRDVATLGNDLAVVDPALFKEYRERNARKWRGLLAPWKIVDCLEASCRLSFVAGAALEREAFRECEASPQSRALIHLFFAERDAGKVVGLPADAVAGAIRTAAVVGAGTMGGGIAMAFAAAGLPVSLLDMSEEALARGMGIIRKNYQTSVERGSLGQDAADRLVASIRPVTRYEDLADADVIVEAVFEDMEVKREVFRRVDAVAKPGAILATNTSTLDVDAIADATTRPTGVVGLHFFSPANVMKLLEIVRGARTSPSVLATSMALGRRLRKIAVVSGNAEGFVGNRILGAYGREADFLLDEGATPWQIDRVLTDFGFAMGLFAMRDMAGLDVIWRIRQQQAARRPAGERYSPLADRICERGWFGQKTGRGYYRYEGRKPVPDTEIEALSESVSRELGVPRSPIGDEEIRQRILCAMVNEGARILEEGVAQRASDIDVVYAYGYGFPSYRGGPMFWAQETGLDKIYRAVCAYHEQHGELWRPSAALAAAAAAGRWPQPH